MTPLSKSVFFAVLDQVEGMSAPKKRRAKRAAEASCGMPLRASHDADATVMVILAQVGLLSLWLSLETNKNTESQIVAGYNHFEGQFFRESNNFASLRHFFEDAA